MSDAFICDQCGVSANTYEKPWRSVEYVADVTTPITDTRDKHFCSPECLRDHASSLVEPTVPEDSDG